MKFQEIDEFIGSLLNDRYGSDNERRDYREMEKNDPITFKGYGSRNGVMYLVDVGYDFYIDVNLLPDSFRMVFRNDFDNLLDIECKNDVVVSDYLSAFLELISEYNDLMKRYSLFNKGSIPIDLTRIKRINEVIK